MAPDTKLPDERGTLAFDGLPMSRPVNRPDFPPSSDIVIFQPQFVEFGGEERVILSLSKGLHAQGKSHSVLCYEDHIDLARYAEQPLRVYPLNPPPQPLRRVLALRAALRRLQVQGNPVPVLFNIQAALHAGLGNARRYHLRIPDTYRLLSYQPGGTLAAPPQGLARNAVASAYHWATRRGVLRATRFLTNTRALADEMQGLYGRRADVLYLGGFGQTAALAPDRQALPLQLLTVSRLQDSKRIDWILQALAQTGPELPPWRLHVVGEGPARRGLTALATELRLTERVQFHGFVSDAELGLLYERSHVFLMPAVQGYGLPAIEALYRRQAIVLNRASGVVEILGGSPWAEVADDTAESFRHSLHSMMKRAADPTFFRQPLPALPTEAGWSQELIAACRW
jgi:glycosyltransferase involved in cell wall biosynthesis